MLEDQVAYLLQRYLGNYVKGLNKEALKISVWQGDVELSNMQLKPEALNALKLPVKVKAGFLGSVKLKVPWSRLGQDPVLLCLDSIYILAEPATHVEGCTEDAVQEAKRNRVLETEMRLLEKAQELKTEVSKSWLGYLVNTIIGNLKLLISNIHIRYEDPESNPGHPFATGVTLERLSAVTVDDSGKEAFVTGGALEQIKKSVSLEKLALYLDADVVSWSVYVSRSRLDQSDWDEVFKNSIKDGKPVYHLGRTHNYVLQPVSGNAQYTKLRPDQIINDDQALQCAKLVLDDVTLNLSKDGYRDIMKLVDNFTGFNRRLKYAHYRPVASVKSDPKSWWKYAYRAISDETKKASGNLAWEHVLKYSRLRKRYIALYASLLKSDMNRVLVDDNEDIATLDRELDIDVIIQWRMLAHKFVEQSLEADAVHKKKNARKSWWSFGRGGKSSKRDDGSIGLTDEDWERLNKVIGYKQTDDVLSTIQNGRDILHTSLEVHMKHNASRLIGDSLNVIAELSCNNLSFSVKLYKQAKIFDIKLASYQLSSPNGPIAESASSSDSLVGIFSYKPVGTELDWSMAAKASPCYITYLKVPIHQIISFFESSNAISQTVALETVAAVQMTIDEVKRTAQQHVNKALRNRSRFLLDLDIDAPKITIPSEVCSDGMRVTKLLLDLGHLMIRTQDDNDSKVSPEMDLYLKFDLVLSDVSAVLVDGDFIWGQPSQVKCSGVNDVCFLPVIYKCGVVVNFQQICLESPSYPSTRLAVRLPSLGFHFSPARYHRLIQIFRVFQEDADISGTVRPVRPWDRADFDGVVPVLNWKGREAVWQMKYLCLAGPFLYILERPGSNYYKMCISLRGKQVSQVSPENIGGINYVLAVFTSGGHDKVVEDVNSVVLRCDSGNSVSIWRNRLRGAIYRASAPARISSLTDEMVESEESQYDQTSFEGDLQSPNLEKLFLTGQLDELKISFSCSREHETSFKTVLMEEESNLFDFRAIGGQVEVSLRSKDIFVGILLKALVIEDLVCCGELQPSYLARSFIQNSNLDRSFFGSPSEGDDKFFEASEDLADEDCSAQSTEGIPVYEGSHPSFQFGLLRLKPRYFYRVPYLLPSKKNVASKDNGGDFIPYQENFVKAQIIIYDQSSLLYDNIDNQVLVRLSTLSFFCRRPTVVAIIGFVAAINVEEEPILSGEVPLSGRIGSAKPIVDHDLTQEWTLKGLLGKGKSRIVFSLIFNMARAQVVLLKEGGDALATLCKDNLETDIKVYPSSFSITASLGNLRISDDSLPPENMYFWMCDMRNSGGSSFVQLEFSSYSPHDDDFEGYDYSLFGQLSEVQIVFLYRFVQEVMIYFSGLAPSDPDSVGKLYDHVTNADRFVMTSETVRSPAVKMDLSFWKPIILMPQMSRSTSFIKLDVVRITVRNSFHWMCGSKDEINAVHLEIMNVQVEDINLNVGDGSELGENILQDVNVISITVRRTLRDLQHQLSTVEASIKMIEIKAALSSKEYEIITECALSNISEAPTRIPSLSNDSPPSSLGTVHSIPTSSGVKPDVKSAALFRTSCSGESPPHESGIWTELKVSVEFELVELCLHPGAARDTSLAIVQASGGWLLYKIDNHGEGLLSATLKSFTVIDDREGTQEEFRLAIRKPPMVGSTNLQSSGYDSDPKKVDCNVTTAKMVPTMLVLDAKFGLLSTDICICAQRPQLLVALDFLLAFVEFFYPTINSMLRNDGEEEPLKVTDAVIFDKPVYFQKSVEFSFSPGNPLIADDERYDEFIYDGKGGSIYLRDFAGSPLVSPSTEPMIYIADGKRLQFKNVAIKNGRLLDSCILLGSNSSYSVSEDDQVYLEDDNENPVLGRSKGGIIKAQTAHVVSNSSNAFTLELQAVGLELTFYNSSKDVGESYVLLNRLLHSEFDGFCRLILKGDTIDTNAKVLALTAESNGVTILEPLDVFLKFSNASGKKNIHIVLSEAFVNFSFNILKLFLALEEDLRSFLQRTSKKMTEECFVFEKIGIINGLPGDAVYSFWRPRPPPGFVTLGDYLTPLDKPPTKGVISISSTYVRLKRPVSFKLIWPLSAPQSDDGCYIWFPEAPPGYVALGCVASLGAAPPPLSSSYCILALLVSPSTLRDCVTILSKGTLDPEVAFWRVDNSVGSFLPADPFTLRLSGKPFELRNIFFYHQSHSSAKFENTNNGHLLRNLTASTSEQLESVINFKFIWSNQGTDCRKEVSVWRPMVSAGMVYFGDVAVVGYEAPRCCVVLRESQDGLFKPPKNFQLVGQIKKQKDVDGISFWLLEPFPGFISLGCIACKGSPRNFDVGALRCLRIDLACGSEFLEDSLWDTSDFSMKTEQFSIWAVDNVMKTFIVRTGFKKPPRRFAFKTEDGETLSRPDDIVIDAEIKTFSAALFDDYGGLMIPLLNISMNGIRFSLHGTTDSFHSAVSFSSAARGYNDKYDVWEPLLETVDGFFRYQYNLKAPSGVSQLRFTFSNDLNFNISVSNANMILQAYASWINLTRVRDSSEYNASVTTAHDQAQDVDIHQRKCYFIVPQNNLGQDILLRVGGPRGTQQISKMRSGHLAPIKVPASKNVLDSHPRKFAMLLRTLLTIVIADAELPKGDGLSSHLYTVNVSISSNREHSGNSLPSQQSMRTFGQSSVNFTSFGNEVVTWNEIFFFRVDSLDHYVVDMIVTDSGRDNVVGSISAPLERVARITDSPLDSFNYSDFLCVNLSIPDHMEMDGAHPNKSHGRIRFGIFTSNSSESKINGKVSGDGGNTGFLEISPTRSGPWTIVRLNYAARISAWRFGSHVISSEVSSGENNRYIKFRSLVAVKNSTDFTLELRLDLKLRNNADRRNGDGASKNIEDPLNIFVIDELFETEKYDSCTGWVGCAVPSGPCVSGDGNLFQEISTVHLPCGWEWVDDWNIDSKSVHNSDGWVYAPDADCIKWPESYDSLRFINYARQRRWIRTRRRINDVADHYISVGLLNPGTSISLPLNVLAEAEPYILKVRPSGLNGIEDYSWSVEMDSQSSSELSSDKNFKSEVCVSALKESEKLLYCGRGTSSSSDNFLGMWFSLSIRASVIGKDALCNPIDDWCICVECPLSLTNFLPMATEFSVLEMQAGGNFYTCSRGILFPGSPVKIHAADMRNALYMCLLPQAGWLPVHEAVLISHPKEAPSKVLNLRSSVSGRIVQIILDQSNDMEFPCLEKRIRIYAACWFSVARCPPLNCKLVDVVGTKERRIHIPFGSNKYNESIFTEIVHEEIYNGNSITSALNFKNLAASLSIDVSGSGQFGPLGDLSPLGNMDGQVEVKASDADGRCMRLYVSSKPCPFQSIPTKVISIRPFITFTNRCGQCLYIKFSTVDEPKVLNVFDSRVTYVHHDEEGPIKIQVQSEDTHWSFPVQIVKEDTLQLVLKKHDGRRTLLRTEIRGYEEGSRFIVVFRFGSTKGPIRIENRMSSSKPIRICQSNVGNDNWVVIAPLSTINFSWDDPYGARLIDIEINGRISIENFDLEKNGTYLIEGPGNMQLHVIEIGDIWVACFISNGMLGPISDGGMRFHIPFGYWESPPQIQKDYASPLEILVELGVLGISFIDHKPIELCYLYLEGVRVLYSSGYGRGSASRLKLLLRYMQLDNQLPLTTMPVLLAPEHSSGQQDVVFKMSITMGTNNSDGIVILPHIGVRVTQNLWRLNVHEPIIWTLIDFYNNLQLDTLPNNSNASQIDPEIRIDLIDVSEVRLKVSLETAPTQRPHGVLGVWGPILSAVGNSFKIQVHIRKVMHENRFMRRSTIAHSVGSRIWRDLIHNPLHLVFALDVLGIASSTLSSLSRRFAELSTDGQFLHLRSQQVRSRRITGVGDGIIQGTEALAQSVAFGVSGVVTKPMESARQNGLLGFAHGLGRAFLGFVVQPVSGALDLVSLTVSGVGASCSRCIEVFLNKGKVQRIRNPRAIRADCILRDYSEEEAVGQMILYLAEASIHIGCKDIFREPSKFAWSDYYENHFVMPNQRIVLISNKRVMLLQCPNMEKMDKIPSKILWDVPWEDLMTVELAKAGSEVPSHLILHLNRFKRSGSFVRVIKCGIDDVPSEDRMPMAVRICTVIRRMWRTFQRDMKCVVLKVPSSAKHVSFRDADSGAVGRRQRHTQLVLKSREFLASSSSGQCEENFVKHSINFVKVWSTEGARKSRCALSKKDAAAVCSVWRAVCDDGYVSVGDIARVGCHPPNAASVYRNIDGVFSPPLGYDLIWRNCEGDYACVVSIWYPRPPEGFVSIGCIAVAGFFEPELDFMCCVVERLAEAAELEDQMIWSAPDSYPWGCHIYQVKSDSLHMVALRQPENVSEWKPLRIKHPIPLPHIP